MKKTGLFKIIVFTLLAIMIITWFVPASYFNAGELADLGKYRIGFFDFFQLIFGAFEFKYFIQMFIFLVSVGALYGVLGKTGKYRAWIEKIASKFRGKELVFLLIVAIVIAALTSVFNYSLLLFIFFPLIISIILSMGYDKVTAAVTTFGAMLIGTIGSTISYNITGVINENLAIDKLSVGIWYRVTLLVLSLAALIFYLVKAKHSTVKKVENKIENAIDNDLFIGEKNANKYSVVPIIVIFVLLFVLLVIGCTNWTSTFNVNIFTKLNEAVMGVKIKDFEIFKSIFGTIEEFGKWYYAEMSVMCLLSALILGRFYRMKHRDMLSYMADGAKKMLPSAIMVVMAYCVIYFAGNTLFYTTIAGWILGATSKFNIFFSSIAIILGSALHVDMLYVGTYVIPQIAAEGASTIVTGTLIQGLYGVTMFVVPTSAALVLGLTYLNIPYTEWIKKTWKLALVLFGIVILTTVAAMLI